MSGEGDLQALRQRYPQADIWVCGYTGPWWAMARGVFAEGRDAADLGQQLAGLLTPVQPDGRWSN